MVNNIREITKKDIIILKNFHLGVCTEPPGICSFCDQNNTKELKLVETSISTDIQQEKKRNKGNLSHETKLNVYDNHLLLESKKENSKAIRTYYLKFLRSVWQDSQFLYVDEERAEVFSTVKNIQLKDITIQFGKSISDCLCYQTESINDIPTISKHRKINYIFLITIFLITALIYHFNRN